MTPSLLSKFYWPCTNCLVLHNFAQTIQYLSNQCFFITKNLTSYKHGRAATSCHPYCPERIQTFVTLCVCSDFFFKTTFLTPNASIVQTWTQIRVLYERNNLHTLNSFIDPSFWCSSELFFSSQMCFSVYSNLLAQPWNMISFKSIAGCLEFTPKILQTFNFSERCTQIPFLSKSTVYFNTNHTFHSVLDLKCKSINTTSKSSHYAEWRNQKIMFCIIYYFI